MRRILLKNSTGLSPNALAPISISYGVPPSQYNPLDEPCPLGLRLRKSPSLLELIQMSLSQGTTAAVPANPAQIADSQPAPTATDKLKASNFPALLLRIGTWEYVSRYEGDLVAKCYFAKHKLVWEVLDCGLKSKIEVQWTDITALKAECPDNGPATLTIMLARQPAFFRETNPQPRKHTLWQATTDFTDGQASINKQHYIQCPPGALNKHYEKLIQCDTRLGILSRHPKLVVDSLYFESEASPVEEYSEVSNSEQCSQMLDGADKGYPVSVFKSVSLVAAAQLPAFKFEHNRFPAQHVSKEEASPQHITVQAVEGNLIRDEDDDVHGGCNGNMEPLKVPPGILLRPSVSMSDLVNHISMQMSSGCLPSAKASECQDMLENIAQVLLNDAQCSTGLDEKSLMKKVNSLCCLLQDDDDGAIRGDKNVCFDLANETPEGGLVKQEPGMPRRDSLGDFLLHLPRIASLPKFSKFLFGIAEDDENHLPT